METYRIVLESTDTGYSAFSPDVPGVGVAADTREEAERLLREAIAFHMEPDDAPENKRVDAKEYVPLLYPNPLPTGIDCALPGNGYSFWPSYLVANPHIRYGYAKESSVR